MIAIFFLLLLFYSTSIFITSINYIRRQLCRTGTAETIVVVLIPCCQGRTVVAESSIAKSVVLASA